MTVAHSPLLVDAIVPPPMSDLDVHVWAVFLDPTRVSASVIELLDAEERARAARFHRSIDRDRYTVAHAALRLLLGLYLDRAAHEIRFQHGQRGKPFLADHPGLWFNLAHTDDLALVAVSRGGEVGVDVERVVDLPDALDVARVCFALSEQQMLRAESRGNRARAFFAGWTRKEAYVKAVGTGLSALQSFEVSLAPGESSRLVRVDGSEREASAWTLQSLEPAPGYLGAVAIRRADAQVTTLLFDSAQLCR